MIVFYDDDCGLCTRSMRIMKHLDVDDQIAYLPLTSCEAGKYDIEAGTVALVMDGKVYLRSEAVRLMLWHVGGLAMVFSLLLAIIPRPIRDAAYRYIAKNRHRFFGGSCEV
ncbi:MAG: DUF393 domain-containing protein [Akkermansiaceae bacterium]